MTTDTHRHSPGILRRWPSAAGLVAGLAIGLGIAGGGEVAAAVAASGFVYLGAAALQRRGAAWPAFAITVVLIGVTRFVPGFDPVWAMIGLAAVLTVVGLVRGAVRPPWGLPLQAAAMLVLSAVALAAVQVSTFWAGVLVAGALLAHAAWDVHHHRTGRVVVASMAEFCAVLDVVVAALVLVATFTSAG